MPNSNNSPVSMFWRRKKAQAAGEVGDRENIAKSRSQNDIFSPTLSNLTAFRRGKKRNAAVGCLAARGAPYQKCSKQKMRPGTIDAIFVFHDVICCMVIDTRYDVPKLLRVSMTPNMQDQCVGAGYYSLLSSSSSPIQMIRARTS
jgi:hypothetical protein